jgi:hypothetical protein
VESAAPEGLTLNTSTHIVPLVPRTLTPTNPERRYVAAFQSGFDAGLPQVQLLFMQSDGGLAPVDAFSGHKAVLSGPAGWHEGFGGRSAAADQTVIARGSTHTHAHLLCPAHPPAAGGYVGYALTTAWDEGNGRVAAATTGPAAADPSQERGAAPQAAADAADAANVRALQVGGMAGLGRE